MPTTRTLLLFFLLASALAGCGSAAPAAVSTPARAVPAATSAPATAAPTAASIRATAAPAPTSPPADDGPVALRDGISIRRVHETGGGFVRLAHDPTTGDLYALDGKANIYRVQVRPDAGAEVTRVYSFAEIGGARDTSGMAFGPDGALYVVGNQAGGITTQAIIRKGMADSSGGRAWSTLAATVPYPRSSTPFDHLFNGIVVSPDGRWVFVNSGSRTDHGEVQPNGGAFPGAREVALTSAIFRLPADAQDLELPDDEAELKAGGYLFADGLRNAYDLAFGPDGELFAVDNGPDADYPDELNWVREGRHYGFPWRFGDQDNPQQFPDYDPARDRLLPRGYTAVDTGTYRNDPDFPPPPPTLTRPVANLGPDGDQFRDQDGAPRDAGDLGRPLYTFTPHRSPLGLVFDTAGSLGGELRGGAFVVSWGAVAGTLSDRGDDLLHLKLTKAGDEYQAQVTQIARGFNDPIDSVLVGNKLYVLDFGGDGAIWEVTLP